MSDRRPDPTTDEQNRRDQLLRAAGSTPADAAPRVVVSESDGATRIDIADSAAVRPGPGPGAEDAAATRAGSMAVASEESM